MTDIRVSVRGTTLRLSWTVGARPHRHTEYTQFEYWDTPSEDQISEAIAFARG